MVQKYLILDREMIEKVFSYDKFVRIEELFNTFELFKGEIDHLDEARLDEVFFTIKAIINDYKTTMMMMSKINHLLNVVQMFI